MRLGSAHGLGAHTWRLLVSALALVMAIGTTSASAASPTACRVQNTDTGKSYTALEAAVDTASRGDRLTVRGTCVGKTVVGTKLVIEGVATTTSGKPTLSGAGKSRVVTITKGVRVRMRSLEIVHGSASKRTGGGGILNKGRLILRDVIVRRNTASAGGGVYNRGRLTLKGTTSIVDNSGWAGHGVYNLGTLTMHDTSRISRNSAAKGDGYGGLAGGGVSNWGRLTLNDDSTISRNTASNAGGVWNCGHVTLNGSSSVRDNMAKSAGGILNDDGCADRDTDTGWKAVLVTNDASTVSGNKTIRGGGGVVNAGVFTLNGSSSVSDNVAVRGSGGGVANHSTLVLNDDSRISGNSTKGGRMCDWCGGLCDGWDCPGVGGGVYLAGVDAAILMTGTSAITGNFAGKLGAGVLCDGPPVWSEVGRPLLLTMVDSAVITGNTATDHGGGIYVTGKVSLDGVMCEAQSFANVYGNTPDDCLFE